MLRHHDIAMLIDTVNAMNWITAHEVHNPHWRKDRWAAVLTSGGPAISALMYAQSASTYSLHRTIVALSLRFHCIVIISASRIFQKHYLAESTQTDPRIHVKFFWEVSEHVLWQSDAAEYKDMWNMR